MQVAVGPLTHGWTVNERNRERGDRKDAGLDRLALARGGTALSGRMSQAGCQLRPLRIPAMERSNWTLSGSVICVNWSVVGLATVR